MFGGRRHCGSGDMVFLVVEKIRFHMLLLKSALLFMSKAPGLKAHGMPFSVLVIDERQEQQ